jgi:hypothetical protein
MDITPQIKSCWGITTQKNQVFIKMKQNSNVASTFCKVFKHMDDLSRWKFIDCDDDKVKVLVIAKILASLQVKSTV